jgi:hypothetical protein
MHAHTEEKIGRIYTRGLQFLVHEPSHHFIIGRLCNTKNPYFSSSVKTEGVFLLGQFSQAVVDVMHLDKVGIPPISSH